MPSLGQRPRQPLLLSPTLKGPWSLTMCCTLWAGFLIHPLRQLCDKGTMSPKMSQDESQSQMPKIMVTEPGSPLQVSVRMGWGPIPYPPWGHGAGSLSEDGLPFLQGWRNGHTPLPLWSLSTQSPIHLDEEDNMPGGIISISIFVLFLMKRSIFGKSKLGNWLWW